MMKAAVAQQPISVSVDAHSINFYQYASGIFNDYKCGTNVNHATLIVGYGVKQSTGNEYWIMKNSWSTYWGEEGYMRVYITDGVSLGICGIQSKPIYPILP